MLKDIAERNIDIIDQYMKRLNLDQKLFEDYVMKEYKKGNDAGVYNYFYIDRNNFFKYCKNTYLRHRITLEADGVYIIDVDSSIVINEHILDNIENPLLYFVKSCYSRENDEYIFPVKFEIRFYLDDFFIKFRKNMEDKCLDENICDKTLYNIVKETVFSELSEKFYIEMMNKCVSYFDVIMNYRE